MALGFVIADRGVECGHVTGPCAPHYHSAPNGPEPVSTHPHIHTHIHTHTHTHTQNIRDNLL